MSSLVASSIGLALIILFLFFFNDTATTEIYTLSLHDALPISIWLKPLVARPTSSSEVTGKRAARLPVTSEDRKSTRLNSSHGYISYAVFCLKKKKNQSGNAQHPTRTKNNQE